MKFIDWNWQQYDLLRRDKETKKTQINYLYPTGLCEGTSGVEFCFIPTKRIEKLEKEIHSLYKFITIENNETTICNEIFYTSKIEGAKTTYKRTQEIHDGKPVELDNYFSDMMVLGGFKATKFLNLYNNKLNEEILIKMWNILVDGACQNEDIRGEKYRVGNVGIGNHMGLNHEYIDEAMKDWINYYNSEKLNNHPFIKAALLHFAFEFMHPFCDGNGRAGRLLMINYLLSQGYEACKAVSFSKSIEKNRLAYDNAFAISENSYSDITPFIEYMLNIYADAFYDIVETEIDKLE